MSANSAITEDMRTNRVLYRISRERVLSRTQIHRVRGTNALIARMVELGWLEPQYELAPNRAGELRLRENFVLTIAGHYAREERAANGNYATC